jgi:hypothetical protein
MRTILAALCAGIMMAAAPAYSHTEDRLKEEVGVEVVSDQGRAFLTIPHLDFWAGRTHIIKKFQEAGKKENYGIIIRNNTPERIGLVVAVDGRNIITGKRSDLKSTEEMYVVGSFEQARFDGWRTAQDTVNRFYFTDKMDAYAQRTFNDSSALGVIAVAVYREQRKPDRLLGLNQQKSSPAPAAEGRATGKASGAMRDESIGTGFGDEQYSPVTRVAFEPESSPVQKTLIKYEWREVLCRKGLLNCGQKSGNRLWDAGEYAPYPPGYQGK